MFLAVGSNVEPRRHLPAALELLAREVAVVAVSPVYETEPVGAPGSPAFLNAAILAETGLEPLELKRRILRPIEGRLGRRRSTDRNAPRPIDLDIALFDDLVCADGERSLRIPDPEIARHAHLARPLADLDPGAVHPATGETLGEIAARLGPPGREVVVAGWSWPDRGPR